LNTAHKTGGNEFILNQGNHSRKCLFNSQVDHNLFDDNRAAGITSSWQCEIIASAEMFQGPALGIAGRRFGPSPKRLPAINKEMNIQTKSYPIFTWKITHGIETKKKSILRRSNLGEVLE